ncbi:hypothetical protein BLOT_009987 [Blomia tropicalis]|nr:hypothetical protein BLOT_009987 [Blomia tropicalis]
MLVDDNHDDDDVDVDEKRPPSSITSPQMDFHYPSAFILNPIPIFLESVFDDIWVQVQINVKVELEIQKRSFTLITETVPNQFPIVFYILERILLDSGSDLLPSLFTVDALSWLDNIRDKYNGKPMSMYKREANV